MQLTDENITLTPALQLYLIRTNISEGTTGDTQFISDSNEMNTGGMPNQSIEILYRKIKNRNQQAREEIII